MNGEERTRRLDDTTGQNGVKDTLHTPLAPETERVATAVLDSAFIVHRALGPGLLESVYEECMVHELSKRALKVERQIIVPIVYDGTTLQNALRKTVAGEASSRRGPSCSSSRRVGSTCLRGHKCLRSQ